MPRLRRGVAEPIGSRLTSSARRRPSSRRVEIAELSKNCSNGGGALMMRSAHGAKKRRLKTPTGGRIGRLRVTPGGSRRLEFLDGLPDQGRDCWDGTRGALSVRARASQDETSGAVEPPLVRYRVADAFTSRSGLRTARRYALLLSRRRERGRRKTCRVDSRGGHPRS